MARFLGLVQGQAGKATRLGSPRSGITAQAQGWDVGVRVCGRDDNGEDEFAIFLTGGSNDSIPSRHLGTVTKGEDGKPVFVVSRKFRAIMDGADPVVMV